MMNTRETPIPWDRLTQLQDEPPPKRASWVAMVAGILLGLGVIVIVTKFLVPVESQASDIWTRLVVGVALGMLAVVGLGATIIAPRGSSVPAKDPVNIRRHHGPR